MPMYRNAVPATQNLSPAQWAKMNTVKMNIEEVEEPETTWITMQNPFNAHRGQAESTRITTKNEHGRSWRAVKYDIYHESCPQPPI